MEIRFDNKVVIVTGSSSGIGKSTAIEFAKAGAKVVVHYNSNSEGADKVVDDITKMGEKAVAIGGDLSEKDNVDKLINDTLSTFGAINILVNNAGTLVERKKVADMSEKLWDRVMDVNMKSMYMCCHAVIPHLRKQSDARIINVSSIAGRNGGGLGAGHYAAAKAASIAFTKNLAKELAPDGILVNSVAPGVITTPYHDEYSSEEMRKKFAANTPLQREGTPEEVAYGILFLASQQASFITGETLEINGGMLMD